MPASTWNKKEATSLPTCSFWREEEGRISAMKLVTAIQSLRVVLLPSPSSLYMPSRISAVSQAFAYMCRTMDLRGLPKRYPRRYTAHLASLIAQVVPLHKLGDVLLMFLLFMASPKAFEE